MAELHKTIGITEDELADTEKEIVHLKHEYEAVQKELAQCRHEIGVIDVEVKSCDKEEISMKDLETMVLLMEKISTSNDFPAKKVSGIETSNKTFSLD